MMYLILFLAFSVAFGILLECNTIRHKKKTLLELQQALQHPTKIEVEPKSEIDDSPVIAAVSAIVASAAGTC